MRVTVTANNQPVEKTAAVSECYGIAFNLKKIKIDREVLLLLLLLFFFHSKCGLIPR